MVKFWGTPSEADIRAMGDDLWLLCCSSEEEVERILSLKRWELPGYRFRADRWLPRAGTSNVCESRGFSWVKVKRIPLHLRSEAVMRDIAKMLGPQAIFDLWGCSLNEVRVRVSNRTPPLKGIRLRFQEEVYWLPVIQEGAGEELGCHERSFELELLDASRKGKDLKGGDPEIQVTEAVSSPLGGGDPFEKSPAIVLTDGGEGAVGGMDSEVTTGTKRMLGEWRVSCQEIETDGHVLKQDGAEKYGFDSLNIEKVKEMGDGAENLNIEKVKGMCDGAENLNIEKVKGMGGGQSAGLGLKECEALLHTFGYGPSLGLLFDGFQEVDKNGAEICNLGPMDLVFGPQQLNPAQFKKASQDVRCGVLDFNQSPSGRDIRHEGEVKPPEGNVSSALILQGKELETADVGTCATVAEEDDVWTCSGAGLSEETEDADSIKGEKLSLQVAHLLNLSMPGDDGAVIQAVVETARGVYSRRKKSKLERELRRLEGGSSTSVSIKEKGERGSGYVVPCLSLNESP
ncbi:hypothetical protein LINPERPRIM_LOCUS13387 [Linum perenne]